MKNYDQKYWIYLKFWSRRSHWPRYFRWFSLLTSPKEINFQNITAHLFCTKFLPSTREIWARMKLLVMVPLNEIFLISLENEFYNTCSHFLWIVQTDILIEAIDKATVKNENDWQPTKLSSVLCDLFFQYVRVLSGSSNKSGFRHMDVVSSRAQRILIIMNKVWTNLN